MIRSTKMTSSLLARHAFLRASHVRVLSTISTAVSTNMMMRSDASSTTTTLVSKPWMTSRLDGYNQNKMKSSSFSIHSLPNNPSSCTRLFSSAAVVHDDLNEIPFLLADIGEGIKEVELLQ